MKYLSKDVLKGFDRYKYTSKDTSPISNYIMHPFWNYLVQFLPIWLAPNLMTFIGFLLTVFNFLLLTFMDENYEASNINSLVKIPTIIWLIVGTLNFISHQLDGTDGKQARRTNTSSPLGELFDHGCDSWVVSMLPLTVISIFGTDEFGVGRWQMFYIIWIMIICFIMSHWEKYLTGILYLPWGYDIGQIGATVACWITFLCSTDGWKIRIGFPMTTTMSTIGYLCVVVSVVVFSLPMTSYNIIQSYVNKTGRMLSFYEAIRPLFSTIMLLTTSFIWAYFSPNLILQTHSRLFLFVVGTVSSNVTVRLIIAQMSQTRCEMINIFSLLYSVGVIMILLLSSISPLLEWIMLWTMCIVFVAGHIVSAILIVRELCDHLKICAFSIPYKSIPPSKKQIE